MGCYVGCCFCCSSALHLFHVHAVVVVCSLGSLGRSAPENLTTIYGDSLLLNFQIVKWYFFLSVLVVLLSCCPAHIVPLFLERMAARTADFAIIS